MRWLSAGAIAACLLFGSVFAAPDKKPEAKPGVSAIAWLAGTWRSERAGRLTEEQWTAPGGGAMLGMVRTIAKGRMVDHAFRLIREGPGGDLVLVPDAARPDAAVLQLETISDSQVVFFNPLQTTPRRIIFTLRPDGSMSVAIESEASAARPEQIFHRVNR